MQEMTESQSETSHDEYMLPILSIIFGFLSGIFGFITGIPSIILGHLALIKCRNTSKPDVAYKRMAIFGLFIGYTGTILSGFALLILKDIFF